MYYIKGIEAYDYIMILEIMEIKYAVIEEYILKS